MSEIVVFDLCDTLVAENTTIGFLRLMAGRHPPVAKALGRWTERDHIGFWIGAIAYRLGRDVARERLIASLRGLSRATIDAGAADYATSVQDRMNLAVVARLERYRAAGTRVVILSSSLDPVVKAIASSLGVEGEGSALTFAGESCTGELATDLTGAKLEAVQRHGDELLAAFSDNWTDLPLLCAARHGVLVVPRGGQRPATAPVGVNEILHA